MYDLGDMIVKISEKINYFENSYKWFIRYSADCCDDAILLCIALPQTTAYAKRCDNETKWMHFITNEEFLKYDNKAQVSKKNLIVHQYIIINF